MNKCVDFLVFLLAGGRNSELTGSLRSQVEKGMTVDLGDPDDDLPQTPTTQRTGPAGADLGSTKKKGRKQRRILGDSDEFGLTGENPLATGLERAGFENFRSYDRRHLHVKSSITDFTKLL